MVPEKGTPIWNMFENYENQYVMLISGPSGQEGNRKEFPGEGAFGKKNSRIENLKRELEQNKKIKKGENGK